MTKHHFFRILLLNVCFAGTASLAIAQEPAKPKVHLIACEESIKKNDFMKAIVDCQEALQDDPQNPEVYIYIAKAYAGVNDYIFAIQNVDRAIDLAPQNAEYYRIRGNYYVVKDAGAAFMDYDKAIELKPDHAPYYVDRGNLYLKENKTDEAIADHEKAVELDPKMGPAYTALATSYQTKEEFDKAVAAATNSLEFDPDNPEILLLRGTIKQKQFFKGNGANPQMVVDALADCSKIIEKNPDHGPGHYCLATAYMYQKKFTETVSECTKALNVEFTKGVYETRAIAYFKLKEYNKSYDDVQRAVELGEVVNPKFIEDLNAALGL